ncbi:MAG: hypothetical protein NZ484_01010 [Patescibacteria group bacterium]|nr:hypothetical protein [Patescibacteria group bacterium]MCX7589522.1 hypothetical protein [Patescibacteria group bacterium]MDW8279944.1 aromatic amino acid transport family protein [bacterium]
MPSIILIATTIGAGIFSLPYIFYKSGWIINIIYFTFLGTFLTIIHYLYSKIILKIKNYRSFLEINKQNLSPIFYAIAFIAIVFGLTLTLLIYIILGGKFLNIIFPNLNFNLTVLIFWFLCSISFLSIKFLNSYEAIGTFFIIFIIFFIFLNNPKINYDILPINFSELFLPFGPILFSLAGWTAIYPMLKQNNFQKIKIETFGISTLIIVLLYLIFILGILNSSKNISEDALSGLNWTYHKLIILALLGLFAIWTSYLPIGLELKNSLDELFSSKISNLIVFFMPIILFGLDLKDFIKTINLTGGIFLSLQYIFILILIKKLLNLKNYQHILINFLMLIFLGAIIYEIYFFIFK